MSEFTFGTPAFIQDLADQPQLQNELNGLWNANIEGWVQQAMPAAPSFYYDPASTPIPSGSPALPVSWSAFPGRLLQYCSATPPVPPPNPYRLSATQVYSLADTGGYSNGGTPAVLPQIPQVFCPEANWSGPLRNYGPYGPRGWLDEYSEWSVTRDQSGNILRVDFCCENPEYWYSLWIVSQNRVVELYNEILNYQVPADRKVTVTLDDLVLKDRDGIIVIDPGTGRSAYNPLNKWNSGPIAVRTAGNMKGGAIHLTSTPNTLQTELGLAGTATQQFASGNQNAQALLCCGDFGQAYRNSDPHIGQSVSQVVAGDLTGGISQLVNLANPFGLYIQTPNFGTFGFGPRITPGKNVPAGAKPSDIWVVVRGQSELIDPVTGSYFPSNSGGNGGFILHAAAQIPPSWLAMDPSLTLADMLINGQPIVWGGQIAQQFDMALYARPLASGAKPPSVPCAGDPTGGAPLQCMYTALWNGYYSINEPSPTDTPLSLASNTTMIAPFVPANGVAATLTLIVSAPITGLPVRIAVLTGIAGGQPDPAVLCTVTGSSPVTYAVPGNSYPGTYNALTVTVTVRPNTQTGLRAVMVTTGSGSATLPAGINITAGA
jgi:hypothetical protein